MTWLDDIRSDGGDGLQLVLAEKLPLLRAEDHVIGIVPRDLRFMPAAAGMLHFMAGEALRGGVAARERSRFYEAQRDALMQLFRISLLYVHPELQEMGGELVLGCGWMLGVRPAPNGEAGTLRDVVLRASELSKEASGFISVLAR